MKEIVPIIMNTDYVRLAAIDIYASFIWTSRYYDVGDFELCVYADVYSINLFKKGYYVIREDDENTGIIESVMIQTNEDGEQLLIIKGRFLASILGRRIIAQQTTVKTTVAAAVVKLINDAIVSPDIEARRIYNFTVGSFVIAAQNIKAQYTGKNLLDVIVELCKTYSVGFKVVMDDNHDFIFTMYDGQDHSYDQTDLPYVVFSEKFDNLISTEYEENYENIVTAVLVAGEGEGLARKTAWATSGETGLRRYEIYADARNTRSNDGEITDAEYLEILEEEGKEQLTKYTTAFSGEVFFDGNRYKTDFDLGDIVVIENSHWGIKINARLVEVIESVNEAGEYTIVPTFGV